MIIKFLLLFTLLSFTNNTGVNETEMSLKKNELAVKYPVGKIYYSQSDSTKWKIIDQSTKKVIFKKNDGSNQGTKVKLKESEICETMICQSKRKSVFAHPNLYIDKDSGFFEWICKGIFIFIMGIICTLLFINHKFGDRIR